MSKFSNSFPLLVSIPHLRPLVSLPPCCLLPRLVHRLPRLRRFALVNPRRRRPLLLPFRHPPSHFCFLAFLLLLLLPPSTIEGCSAKVTTITLLSATAERERVKKEGYQNLFSASYKEEAFKIAALKSLKNRDGFLLRKCGIINPSYNIWLLLFLLSTSHAHCMCTDL